jgi:spore maturation protein CgeB
VAFLEIAFYGSSLLSTYWNGAATYYRGLLKALAERGHRVTFYEPDIFERQKHRDMDPPDWARVVVYEGTEDAARQALQQGRSADVLVKASGVGAFDDLLAEGVIAARGPEALAVYWDVDAPATLDKLAADRADILHRLLPRFDMVLTYGGGDPVVRRYRGFGARGCVPIYNALDPSTHRPGAPDPRFACDLVFLGNRLPDRESRVEEFFLRAAALAPDKQFLLAGNGWADKPVPPNVRVLGHVGSGEHNALNASALAVMNISREGMARNGWSPATRLFEAAGAGACNITDFWAGIPDFLEPDWEVLVADDGAEVARILRELTPERARTIGERARRRILSEHTYERRAAQVEDLLLNALTWKARKTA